MLSEGTPIPPANPNFTDHIWLNRNSPIISETSVGYSCHRKYCMVLSSKFSVFSEGIDIHRSYPMFTDHIRWNSSLKKSDAIVGYSYHRKCCMVLLHNQGTERIRSAPVILQHVKIIYWFNKKIIYGTQKCIYGLYILLMDQNNIYGLKIYL